jgi:hypothetical protein
MCADSFGNAADLLEIAAIGDRAAWVVRICQDDESRTRRDRPPYAIRIDFILIPKRPLEANGPRSEQSRSAKQRVITRALHQHVVARLEHRG